MRRVRDQPLDRLQVVGAVSVGKSGGLRERSHAPLRHGQTHDVAVVQAGLALRERWPRWGPKKLRVKLAERHPELAVPAASTIGDGCGVRAGWRARVGGDVVRLTRSPLPR